MPEQLKRYVLLMLTMASAISTVICLLFVLGLQNKQTLAEAINSSQVTAEISGMAENASFTEPMLEVTINKPTFWPLTIIIPQGSILESASEAADVVTLQSETLILFGGSSVQIFAYSLDYNKSFPNNNSKYLIGSTDEKLTQVLNNIVGLSAQDEFAGQVAVWKTHQNASDDDLKTALGNLYTDEYAARANKLLGANEPQVSSSTNSWLSWVGLILSAALTLIFGTLFWRSGPEKKVIDQLSNWQLLVKGVMSEVWLAQRSKKKYIIKFPRKYKNNKYRAKTINYRFETEIEKHSLLTHANIVPLIESGECLHPESKEPSPYIILDYIDGCTLQQIIHEQKGTPLSDYIIWHITSQIIDGLSYTHRQNIVHRDITPKNIMVDQKETVYIIDFGNSTSIHSDYTDLQEYLLAVGTAPYCPPNSIMNVPERDFYALAIIIYAMYGGEVMKGQNTREIKEAIEQEIDALDHMPEWLRLVLQQCLNGEYKDSVQLRKALRLQQLRQIVDGAGTGVQPRNNQLADLITKTRDKKEALVSDA